MNRIPFFLISIGLVLSLFSCQQDQKKQSETNFTDLENVDFSFQTKLKYAEGFQVVNHDNYKEIYVFNPLGDDTLVTYITTFSGVDLPDSIKSKGQVVEVPLKNLACLSTTHISSLSILDLREKLVGCLSTGYIWDKAVQERVVNGKIQEIGKGMSINVEQIIALSPDALMQSFMDKTDIDGNISGSGITILYNNEWKETHILGRTEWIKFIGLFFGKEQEADSIFNAVESNYLKIKKEVANIEPKREIMYGTDYKGTWYQPQSNTYVVQIFRDANTTYQGFGEGNASIPINFEKVYDKYHDADYWFCSVSKMNTLDEFLSSNEHYASFKPAKTGQVFANNKREKPNGGNDYWESAVNRPDLLLKDIVSILYPDLYPNYETTYWKHLK